jgi:DNA-binding Lrp family transcriptional regulator
MSVSIGISSLFMPILVISTAAFGEMTMDDLDDHLLARLRDNARAPVAELARALGLSRTTVQSRLAKLERSGVIAGYAVKLSEAREAALIHAFVMLTVEPKQAASVTMALKRMPGVRKLQSVSGPSDMIATVEAPSVGDMDTLIDEIGALRGVERTNSSIVLATKFIR